MKMILGGKHVASNNSEVIEVYNLATGEFADTVPSATSQDVERALEIAREGKDIWSKVPFEKEVRNTVSLPICSSMLRIVLRSHWLRKRERFFPMRWVRLVTEAFSEVMAEKMRHTYEQVLPHDTDLVIVRHDPLGVVACLVPFQFSYELYAHKVVSA